MQTIVEEVLYLISLGYRAEQQKFILAGLDRAIDEFTPDDWIQICDETLGWHCRNFYNIGYKHEASKRYSGSNYPGEEQFSDYRLQ